MPLHDRSPGFAGAISLLEEQIAPTGGVAAFDFQNISSTYRHLRLEGMIRSEVAATVATIVLRFNNDSSAANYAWINGVMSATSDTIAEDTGDPQGRIGRCCGANSPANCYSAVTIVVPYYAVTDYLKVALAMSGGKEALTSGNITMERNQVTWASTAAINRVQISTNAFGSDVAELSRLSLYGVQ